MSNTLIFLFNSTNGFPTTRQWMRNHDFATNQFNRNLKYMFQLDDHSDYFEEFTTYLNNKWACELGYLLPLQQLLSPQRLTRTPQLRPTLE